jgi:uncharacterized membrane protein YdfJ with MMPL/SSD domain
VINPIVDFSTSRRGKWIVVAVWFLLTALIVPIAPKLSDVTSNDETSFLPNRSESTQVARLVKERFPSNGVPAIIVFRDAAGLSDADYEQARALNDWLTSGDAGSNVEGVVSIFTVPQARDRLVSKDGTAMTMVANITGQPAEQAYTDTIERIRDYTGQIDGASLQVKVSGPGGLFADLLKVFQAIDGFLLIVTGALVLVLLVVIYRSPVVALVPLVSVGWVFSLASAIGALLAKNVGLPVNGQATGIMTVLLFGAGTDYCLFISSRYREELVQTEDKHEAMRRTMRGVGEAILSAAGTILLATLLLLFASLKSNQALGPLLAVAVGTMLVASLTLVPAILTILGRRSFWPFVPRFDPEHHRVTHFGIWSRIARLVARRPGAVLAGTVALFLVMAAGVATLNQDFDTISSLPSGSESREGFELLRAGFPAGDLAPTDAYVLLPAGSSAFDSQSLQAIDRITTELAQQPGVASVSGPSRPFGAQAPVGPDQVQAAYDSLPQQVRDGIRQGEQPGGGGGSDPNSPEAQATGLVAAASGFVAPDGGAARLQIVLIQNPYGLTAINEIPELRQAARSAAESAGLGRDSVLIGGPTATSYDTKVANDRDERVVLPLILLAIGIVLVLLLRSLVAPLYLLATTVISYFAALGLSTVVFQYLLGQAGVGSGIPFYLFVFLVALGIDYNIYLMARVREEAKRHDLDVGTVRALGRTGGVITSAGIILAGTFAALMTLPLQVLFQLGFAVAIGVLMDTFIVRTLTVPAIVLLLGHWNWWPRHEDVRPGREPAEAEIEPERLPATR